MPGSQAIDQSDYFSSNAHQVVIFFRYRKKIRFLGVDFESPTAPDNTINNNQPVQVFSTIVIEQ